MSEDLKAAGIDRRHTAGAGFRAALRQRVASIVEGREASRRSPESDNSTVVDVGAASRSAAARSRGRKARLLLIGASAAAIVAAITAAVALHDSTPPVTAPSPAATIPVAEVPATTAATPHLEAAVAWILEDPPRGEVATANDVSTYRPGTGLMELTGSGNYVALRTCQIPSITCVGARGWAYVAGSRDEPELRSGLLGVADDVVLSALDDRFFVASARSPLREPPPSPTAWLIDAETGRRGKLTWNEGPVAMTSTDQRLVLFPARVHPYYLAPLSPFLPCVFDARDGTISPLSVPAHATAALHVHQPGSGRIWIGTARVEGHAGLAYTDDGGATWIDVELPEGLRPTTDELLFRADVPLPDELLQVAASGDRVAVSPAWGSTSRGHRLFTSHDAGRTWAVVRYESVGNGRELFVQHDRLVLASSDDYFVSTLLVSSSATNWAQLEDTNASIDGRADFGVGQRGIAVIKRFDRTPGSMFSADLEQWWTLPQVRDVPGG